MHIFIKLLRQRLLHLNMLLLHRREWRRMSLVTVVWNNTQTMNWLSKQDLQRTNQRRAANRAQNYSSVSSRCGHSTCCIFPFVITLCILPGGRLATGFPATARTLVGTLTSWRKTNIMTNVRKVQWLDQGGGRVAFFECGRYDSIIIVISQKITELLWLTRLLWNVSAVSHRAPSAIDRITQIISNAAVLSKVTLTRDSSHSSAQSTSDDDSLKTRSGSTLRFSFLYGRYTSTNQWATSAICQPVNYTTIFNTQITFLRQCAWLPAAGTHGCYLLSLQLAWQEAADQSQRSPLIWPRRLATTWYASSVSRHFSRQLPNIWPATGNTYCSGL